MNETTNYRLKKPEGNENVSIETINNNMDVIDEALYEAAESLRESATKEYVDQQITLITETGIPKLNVYPILQIATEDGQTEFEITLETFDAATDTVLIQSGRAMLFPNADFSVVDNKVVLREGVPKDVTIGIYVFKNVPLGEDGSVSGKVIGVGTMPLNRLENMPTAEQVGAFGYFPANYKTNLNEFTELGSFIHYQKLTNGIDTTYGIVWNMRGATDEYRIQYQFDAVAKRTYERYCVDGVWSDWGTPYLPRTGGEVNGPLSLINGNVLRIFHQDYRTEIHQYNKDAYVRSTDGNNYADIVVGLKSAPFYNVLIDGVAAQYLLYGTHNVTTGTWDLWSGNSALTTDYIYQQYE
ncbi:MAG: hypothetical protein IJO55_04090 [Lachnospiraceae bacterium]|nr:hypothetical protein [Lachnospiraceae bacterium]